MLVWFALFIGAAAASPLLKPQVTEIVCSAMGGVKMVSLNTDENSQAPATSVMDCPLCMPMVAPAPGLLTTSTPGNLPYALPHLESARLASLIGLPWQARAPPHPLF